LLNPY